MDPKGPSVLISEEAIQARVAELAHRISTDYSHVEELLLVGILRGSFIFLADLSRRLTIPRRIDFMALASYGHTTTTTGAVRLIMDLRSDIAQTHVLIVEDIVDTGCTLDFLISALRPRKPASLRTCSLLRKPSRLTKNVQIDYLGFDIPNAWVVGYGLDYADAYRALPYIGIVEPERG